jgi:hypothetical protein
VAETVLPLFDVPDGVLRRLVIMRRRVSRRGNLSPRAALAAGADRPHAEPPLPRDLRPNSGRCKPEIDPERPVTFHKSGLSLFIGSLTYETQAPCYH